MNLETLKKRNAENVKQVTLADGQVVHLRKMTATDGLEVSKALLAAGHTDPDSPEPDVSEFVKFHVLILSKTIVEQTETGWEHALNSDEGRKELAKLDFATLQLLSVAAQEWNGMGGDVAKKNSIEQSDSSTS